MTALLVFNGFLDLLLAVVILRAEWQRRENQLLALAALVDAGRIAAIGLLISRGFVMTDALPQLACSLGRILVMCPVLEFTYAFPYGGRPRPWVRAVALSATALATLLALYPETSAWIGSWPFRVAYFSPFFIATIRAAWQNLARIRSEGSDIGERTFLAALIVRFGAELATSILITPFFPELLATAITFDMVVAVLSHSVAAYAVLKYRFFRVGGLVAESLLYGVFWLGCWTLVVGGAELAATEIHEPVLRALAFSGLMIVPLATWGLVARGAPLMKSALLYPFEGKRRRFKAVFETVLRESATMTDAAALCTLTRDAIASLSGGTVTLWKVAHSKSVASERGLLGPSLPVELAQYLQGALVPALHQRSQIEPRLAQAIALLGADALVPVRAQGQLMCAFSIKSRFVEQDMLDVASLLAEHLGNKLAHQAMRDYASNLQNQLEVSRHLSTLGSFAAAIAHDIRTPLTSVKMNLEIIRGWPELNCDMRECAEMALEELGRMNSYVSGMLDYVKPVQLRALDFDIRSLIEEAGRTLQPALDAHEVALRCAWSEASVPLSMRADVVRVKQVLLNLLENAADASLPGTTIDVAVSEVPDACVEIAIRDHGHGIAEFNLERVFEPFFTTREEGTGLGLAIVGKLVRAHGGSVRVTSRIGEGSTFTVRLPKGGAGSPELSLQTLPAIAGFADSAGAEFRAAE